MEMAYTGLVRRWNQCWILQVQFGIPVEKLFRTNWKKVQNRAARFVTGNYNFETGSMTKSLEQLNWESLKQRRKI